MKFSSVDLKCIFQGCKLKEVQTTILDSTILRLFLTLYLQRYAKSSYRRVCMCAL